MSTALRPEDFRRPPPIDLDRSGEAAGRFLSPALAFHPALAPSERAEALHAERLGQRANDLVARDPFAFRAAARLAFGDKADPQTLGTLIGLARSDQLPVPPVRFVEPGSLGIGALGAYAAAGGPGGGGLILLDRTLLTDPARLETVHLEEFGHHLDRLLGGPDAPGDEGAIFARALLHPTAAPSGDALASLRIENDQARALFESRTVTLELNGPERAGTYVDPVPLDPIVVPLDLPPPHDPYAPNAEDEHDQPQPGGGGRTTVVPVPPLGTTRDAPRPSLAAERVSNAQLAYEAAPEWIGRLSITTPAQMGFLLGLMPTEAGDTALYEFPIADDVRVRLDNTMLDPGHLEIGGEDTGILVHPIRDADGGVTGFAPDTYFGQSELHRLTGVWVALSENASTDDMPVVTVGEGSVRGAEKPLGGNERQRRQTALENASGLLIAEEEGRNLERIPDPTTDVSQPDYIDIETGERIDIYSPEGNVNTIRNEIDRKMKKDQADIIVVNVTNNERPLQDILDRIESMPRDRQVTVIDGQGEFHRFDPNVETLGSLETVPEDRVA